MNKKFYKRDFILYNGLTNKSVMANFNKKGEKYEKDL